MYEYRLALELWGTLALAAFVTPLTLAGLRQVIDFFHHAEHDDRCSLASVPSTPRPL